MGGIKNTQEVNIPEQYSLDACQNNPDFDGSLRQGLNAANDKLTDMAVIADFYKMRTFKTIGQNGYIKCATIKAVYNYCNVPIMFEISGRAWHMPAQLYILFGNTSTLDLELRNFVYTGKIHVDVALCKSDISTWDLYVKKSEAYDYICIHRYNYSSYTHFNISFPGELVADLPTNALQTIHPTKYTD